MVVHYVTSNHLGSPFIVTDAGGMVVSRHDYLPFGEELMAGIGVRSVAMGYGVNDGLRQGFTGKERDNETGLDYFLARYYSSVHGRFTSTDEFTGGPVELFSFAQMAAANPTFYADITEPQSLNKYQYTFNNPLRYVDSDGHLAGDPDKNLDTLQTVLSVVGFVPVFGDVVDLANGGISAARGDYVDAGLNAVSAIPVIGSFIGVGGKIAKGAKALSKADDIGDAAKSIKKTEEFVVDTNAVISDAKRLVPAADKKGVDLIKSQISDIELKRPPKAAKFIPSVELPSVNARINVRDLLTKRKTGNFADGIIGATALERGATLISNDKALRTAVTNLGGKAIRPKEFLKR
jgi:RHS repeat-associated protein